MTEQGPLEQQPQLQPKTRPLLVQKHIDSGELTIEDQDRSLPVYLKTRSVEKIMRSPRADLRRSQDSTAALSSPNVLAAGVGRDMVPSSTGHVHSTAILEMWKASRFGGGADADPTSSPLPARAFLAGNSNRQTASTVTSQMIKTQLSAIQTGIERAFVKFIQLGLSISPLEDLIRRRRKRAEKRRFGLDAMIDLLKSVTFVGVKQEALKFLAPALQSPSPNPASRPYLTNILVRDYLF